MNKEFCTTFSKLDIGSSKPTSVSMDIVHVEITEENMFMDFAKAFVNEAYRVNPLKAEQVSLSIPELEWYITYLVRQRIDYVNGECTEFRKLKALYIPVWIQYALTMIGEVTIRELGLKLLPTLNSEALEGQHPLTYDEALAISEKIGSFEDDLQIVKDGMPRTTEGNRDVMSTALIADYVRALRPVEHVASTYVTAFMGMKLQEELAMGVLYRVQYDDVAFIQSALTRQKEIF